MTPDRLVVSSEKARRLAVTKQRLAGKFPAKPTADAIVSTIRDLAYVQWDPVSIVAPSHLLSLWARLGNYRPEELERLLWEERRLFLHWTPAASIVLTEDYPLYLSLMKRYPESLSHSWNNHRVRARAFLASHPELRRKILKQLSGGPLTVGQFADHARTKRDGGDFEPGSDVSQMLFHLLMSGEVMVVGHEGAQNLWGLTEEFLPGVSGVRELSESEAEREAAQRAIRALGIAGPSDITYYFVRGRYEHLRETLARLEQEAVIRRVTVEGEDGKGERYVHSQDLPVLDAMDRRPLEPRLSLLPPFDNLICSTSWTERRFGFRYVREQFLPADKRRYGTYVLPILWGSRFIGRIDPRMDRRSGSLVINAVHAEPGAPTDREVGTELGESIGRLATFLGASSVSYTSRVPKAWKASLRSGSSRSGPPSG